MAQRKARRRAAEVAEQQARREVRLASQAAYMDRIRIDGFGGGEDGLTIAEYQSIMREAGVNCPLIVIL